MKKRNFCLPMLFVCLASMNAHADAITYTYTGSDFTNLQAFQEPQVYTASDYVSVQFTLSAPLADNLNGYVTPTSFSASDGVQTITDTSANLYNTYFLFTTDGSGAITLWSVNIETDSSGVYDLIELSGNDVSGGQDYVMFNDSQAGFANASVYPSTGSWSTAASAAPEPSTLLLLSTGLVGLGGMARRRFQTA